MARTVTTATRTKPEAARLLHLEVLERRRISASYARVTLGGGEIAGFRHRGWDQWFRLFLPVSEASLARLPAKLDTLAYLRYLAIAKTDRPVLRNYTVRAYRADGPRGAEIDVDFVVHGSADDGTAGPAATWAQSCAAGDAVAILDEGVMFTPPPVFDGEVVLVGDETALPAVAGILGALPADVVGTAIVEIPEEEDRQELVRPAGIDLRWVVRDNPGATPGVAALRVATAVPVPVRPALAWAAGEHALPVTLRRHWLAAGVPKDVISFTGYWKAAGRH
jgi:NADPH-dependent ferric siderophore reductase